MSNTLTKIVTELFAAGRSDSGLARLATLLDVSPEELNSASENPRLCYRPYTVRKRHGGLRQIAAPSSPLKRLQRRLLHRYLAQLHVHDAAITFRPGASIATHARRHMGQALILTVDLADFFPSTTVRRIRRWYRNLGWDGRALDVLMRLSVYRGGLPQGAPTSPALSNLVNQPLDERLTELASLHGARYSRYCDDLAFSFAADHEPAAFRIQVEQAVNRFDYSIQPQKGWRLQHAADPPELTGVVIAGRRLRLPERILQKIRRLKSRWFSSDPAAEQRLAGYRGVLRMLK